MTSDALWNRYAAIWSLNNGERETELAACLADDATYCDPNGLLTGLSALSEYMDQFQSNVPGGRFRIRSVLHHQDRSLAHWSLHSAQGDVLQTGTSFGTVAEDGRLRAISGFFHPGSQGAPA